MTRCDVISGRQRFVCGQSEHEFWCAPIRVCGVVVDIGISVSPELFQLLGLNNCRSERNKYVPLLSEHTFLQLLASVPLGIGVFCFLLQHHKFILSVLLFLEQSKKMKPLVGKPVFGSVNFYEVSAFNITCQFYSETISRDFIFVSCYDVSYIG